MESERAKTGIPGFDELVEGGFPSGSAVLVSGAAGTGKSIFAIQFLVAGARAGEKGLYITFEEREKDIKDQAKLFGWDLDSFMRDRKLKIVSIKYPYLRKSAKDMIELSERANTTLDRIGKELEEFRPARVVIDSVATLSTALPPDIGTERTRDVITALLTLLKDAGTTSILTSELATESAWFSRDEISEFLADGIVLLKSVSMGNSVNRTLEVRKMRRTAINGETHSYDITKKGVSVK